MKEETTLSHIGNDTEFNLRVALTHNSIIESMSAYEPSGRMLVPLVNRLLLLFQRPMIIVLLDRRAGRQETRFYHSMQNVIGLAKPVSRYIEKLLDEPPERMRLWCVSVQRDTYHIGILGVDYVFDKSGYPNADSRLSKPRTVELSLLRKLHLSIRSHKASSSLFLRHWITIINSLPAAELPRLPQKPAVMLSKDHFEGLRGRAISSIYAKIDTLYWEIRGGGPGNFGSNTGRSGSHLLWVRHRLAMKRKAQWRPPTVWFFLRQWQSSGTAAIIPVFTQCMAEDAAAVLIQLWSLDPDWLGKQIEAYLAEIDIPPKNLSDCKALSCLLLNRHSPSNHLNAISHSITSIAFQSGVTSFLESNEAKPARNFVDHTALGPSGLIEEDGLGDVLFCKPVLVADYPWFCTVTKARAGIRGISKFDDWYHNFLFGSALHAKRIASFVQSAVREIFLQSIEDELLDIFLACSVYEARESPVLELSLSTLVRQGNLLFDELARIFPYGKVVMAYRELVAREGHDSLRYGPFTVRSNSFVLFSGLLYFRLQRNPYYLTDANALDLAMSVDVQRALQRFANKAERTTFAPLVRTNLEESARQKRPN